jgi:hypothetical protein
MEADETWGNQFYFWGEDYHVEDGHPLEDHNPTGGEEDYLEDQLQKMNTKFVSQGVPVLLGEFGAIKRTGNPELTGDDLQLHLDSREYFHQQVTDMSNSMGIAPIYWDNGWAGANGFALFNRNTAAILDQDMIDALTGGPGGLNGDYNDDGVIDAADYTVWRDAFESSGTLLNDPTGGIATEEDYEYWRANFGATAPTSGVGAIASSAPQTAVPEPSAILLALIGCLALRIAGRPKRG